MIPPSPAAVPGSLEDSVEEVRQHSMALLEREVVKARRGKEKLARTIRGD